MDILNLTIFIVRGTLNLTWKKPISTIKSKIYELNQMLILNFMRRKIS